MTTAAPRWVIVDDGDASVQYTGTWTQDQGITGLASASNEKLMGLAYNGTSRWSQTSGNGLSFFFYGTQIYLNGGMNFEPTGNVATCFIDGVAVSNVTALTIKSGIPGTNGNPLCVSGLLANGQHTMTLYLSNIGRDPSLGPGGVGTSTQSNRIWVDSIFYAPTTNVSESQMPAEQFFPDAAEVKFSSGWQQDATVPGVQLTRQTGATVAFNFTGVGISYFGQLLNDTSTTRSTATYSIDGRTPVSFDLVSYANSSVPFNTPLFSAQVPDGDHTLHVAYTGKTAVTTRPLPMQYLIVQHAASVSGAISANPSASTHKPKHIGAIIGAVAAVIVLLLLVLACVFFFLRRRRQRRFDDRRRLPSMYAKQSSNWSESTVDAVPTSLPHPGRRSISSVESSDDIHDMRQYVVQYPETAQASFVPEPFIANFTESPSSLPRKLISHNQSPSETVVMHEDSGIRLPNEDVGQTRRIVEVPPSYSVE